MTKARDTSQIDWHKLFYYDESSPSCLRWSTNRGSRVKSGDIAGYVQGKEGNKYWVVETSGTAYLCHRIVWELQRYRLLSWQNIDHLNGNSLDNKVGNLQPKKHEGNCQNKKKQANNSSGVTGVYLNIKKGANGKYKEYWMASWIDEYGKQRTKCFSIDRLGSDEAFDAACTYRSDKIDELNAVGKHYTKTHGERDDRNSLH